MNLVNKKSLKEKKACRDGRRWFLENIGVLEISKIKDIEGDYNGYVRWLKEQYLGDIIPPEKLEPSKQEVRKLDPGNRIS